MNIRKILGFCFLIVFVACSNPNEICGCFHPTNIDIALSYEDQAGKDLLNPEHEDALTKSNLDIYYRKDDRYDGRLKADSFEIVGKEDQHNLLLLGLSSTPFEEREASILIDFPNAPNDTLDIQAKGSEYELYATQIWYNSKLVWSNEGDEGTQRFFKVTKTISSN